MPPRTPADFPGRPNSEVVPTNSDKLDLEERAERHRRMEETASHERTPLWRRLFRRSRSRN